MLYGFVNNPEAKRMCFQELQEQDPDLLIVCPLCVIALLEQVLAHFRHMTRSERDGVIEMLMPSKDWVDGLIDTWIKGMGKGIPAPSQPMPAAPQADEPPQEP